MNFQVTNRNYQNLPLVLKPPPPKLRLDENPPPPKLSPLELARDEAFRAYGEQNKKFQLIKDVSDDLTVGYNVGETLVAKLQQTHDLKEQVYRRGITFFTTNEHVFTTMAAVYTSQLGLHEDTQALEAMKEGANKGLEDIASLGTVLEKAALEAGYGSTISSDSVQKLVDAVVTFQTESINDIERLRKESTENAQKITEIVDAGKRKCRDTILSYKRAAVAELPQSA